MSGQQREWFRQFLELHPKNSVQVASATKLWTEKVKSEACFEFLMVALRQECAGDTTYLLGTGKWLADHLELFANGVTAKPATAAAAGDVAQTRVDRRQAEIERSWDLQGASNGRR